MTPEEMIAKSVLETIKTYNKKHTEGYDTKAQIKNIVDRTAWVHIPGGIDETPVELTISAKVGDWVQLRVSGGKAWITGNATSPPTDDSTAIAVGNNLKMTVVEVEHLSETVKEVEKLVADAITVEELEAGTLSSTLINAINLAVVGTIDANRVNIDDLVATQAFITALNTQILNSDVITTSKLNSGEVSSEIINAINISTGTIYASRIILKDPETGETYLIEPETHFVIADPQPTAETWNNGQGYYVLSAGHYIDMTGSPYAVGVTYYVISGITQNHVKVDANVLEDLSITADKIRAGEIITEKLNITEHITFDFKKTLLTAEPTDWAENYKSYYRAAADIDEYEPISDATCPTWVPNTFYKRDRSEPQMIMGQKANYAIVIDKQQMTFWHDRSIINQTMM